MTVPKPPSTSDELTGKSKEYRDNLEAIKKTQLEKEYEERRLEAQKRRAAINADEDASGNMSTDRDKKTNQPMTKWERARSAAEEELEAGMHSYVNAQSAIFALVNMCKHMSVALHHDLVDPLKGLVMIYVDKWGVKREPMLDYPPLTYLVSCDDNGNLKIADLKIEGVSDEVLKNPKMAKDVCQLNKTNYDVVSFWMQEEWNCSQVRPAKWRDASGKTYTQDEFEAEKNKDKWSCTLVDAGQWEDEDGNLINQEAFETMRNDKTKGLDAYLKKWQPDLKFQPEQPEVKDEAEKDAEEAPSHAPGRR